MKNITKATILLKMILSSSLSANKIVGILQPSALSTIKSQIAGQVESIKYDIARDVKKNKTLVQINKVDYRLEYSLALENNRLSSSNLNLAKINYSRFTKLYTKKSITAQDYDVSKNTYENAISQNIISKISLKQIKRKLDKTSIRAPYNGVISDRFVEVGDWVDVGDNIVQFINVKKLKAVFYILQHDYADFKTGSNVELIIPTLNNKKIKGEILLIAPSIVSGNPGYKMEILVNNPNNELKSGFNVELQINENTKKD